MIQSIDIEKLTSMLQTVPIDLEAYECWLSEPSETAPSFFSVGSCNARLRDRSQWNTSGREIYDANDISPHARAVARVLHEFANKEFIAQQTRNGDLWFRGLNGVDKQLVKSRIALLNLPSPPPDFSSWRGGFLFTGNDIQTFVGTFLDYAYMFQWRDIEIISLQEPLILTLDHHLCVQYTSTREKLINLIRARVKDEGILEYPDRQLSRGG